MYLIGIDISKYKHNCFIATNAGVQIKEFVFTNSFEGFMDFLKVIQSLDQTQDIRIGLESTGHYGTNLKQFITASSYTFFEFNPYLTHKFSKALTLRRTKTDKVDAKTISRMLATVDYKALHNRVYHINELKQLVRYRDKRLEERSKTLVTLTNLLDIVFPEFKPFFNNRLGKGAFLILKRYKTKETIAKLKLRNYQSLKDKTSCRLTYPKFVRLVDLAKTSVGLSLAVHNSLILTTIGHYEFLDKTLKTLDEQIKSLFLELDSKLLSIPGLGIIAAANILAEIGDIKNFSRPAKLIAFAGFDVSIKQSGLVEHHGKIVKRGSSLLRKSIWLYAFSSLRLIPKMHDYYKIKKDKGKHHKVALTHVCRKLIRIIFHLESNQVDFNHSLLK